MLSNILYTGVELSENVVEFLPLYPSRYIKAITTPFRIKQRTRENVLKNMRLPRNDQLHSGEKLHIINIKAFSTRYAIYIPIISEGGSRLNCLNCT